MEGEALDIEALAADFENYVERAANGEQFVIVKGDVKCALISFDTWREGPVPA